MLIEGSTGQIRPVHQLLNGDLLNRLLFDQFREASADC